MVPLAAGGHPTDPDNLQALCVPCHVAKTRAERGGPAVAGRKEWAEFLAGENAKDS